MFKSAIRSEVISVTAHENKLDVILTKPEGFIYQAGQYGGFKIVDATSDKTRTLSFASSPDEPNIRIGTQLSDPPSTFKKILSTLKKGAIIEIKGPHGDFLWKDLKPQVVMIGLGVGITPIRSLLLSRSDLSQVTLIYAGASYKLYLEEFKSLESSHGLTLIETKHRDDLSEAIKQLKDTEETEFYVSGSMKAITGTTKAIKSLGVKGKFIYSDIFTGY